MVVLLIMMRKGFVRLFLIRRYVAYPYVQVLLLRIGGSWCMELGCFFLEKETSFWDRAKGGRIFIKRAQVSFRLVCEIENNLIKWIVIIDFKKN